MPKNILQKLIKSFISEFSKKNKKFDWNINKRTTSLYPKKTFGKKMEDGLHRFFALRDIQERLGIAYKASNRTKKSLFKKFSIDNINIINQKNLFRFI